MRGKGADCPNYRHGGASRGQHTKEYKAWASMIRRCEMPSQESYPLYGGRGITIDATWRSDFASFLRDVGAAPTPRHTLDRIDTNGNYAPGNVRWATPKQQCRNTRVNQLVTHDGETMTVADWAERIGIKYQTLWARLFVYKWDAERALGATVR